MAEFLRFVVDTNVLVSRLLAPRSTAAQAVDRALDRGSRAGSTKGWHGTSSTPTFPARIGASSSACSAASCSSYRSLAG